MFNPYLATILDILLIKLSFRLKFHNFIFLYLFTIIDLKVSFIKFLPVALAGHDHERPGFFVKAEKEFLFLQKRFGWQFVVRAQIQLS